MLSGTACTPPAHTPESPDLARLERLSTSRQYKDGKFISVEVMMSRSIRDFVSATWDFLFNGTERTPDSRLPVQPVDSEYFNTTHNDQLNVTWLGHSSLMIHMDGFKILTDPVFQKRISIFGPTRFNGDVPVDVSDIGPFDVVIISHNHYDHLNKQSVQALNDKVKKFIVPLAVGDKLVSWGVSREKITELDWWEEYRFNEKLMIAATPAQHFSGRGLTDRNKTLWASWVIKSTAHSIFFSGDSGYFDGFKEIGGKYGPFDMTFLECGAYNPSWHAVHMYPEETIRAHLDLNGKILHPIHWGTFNLSMHPWYEPMERLTAAAELKGVTTALPIVGQTTVYGEKIPVARWWEQARGEKEYSTGYRSSLGETGSR